MSGHKTPTTAACWCCRISREKVSSCLPPFSVNPYEEAEVGDAILHALRKLLAQPRNAMRRH